MAGIDLYSGSEGDLLDQQLKELIASDSELNKSKSLFQNQDMVKLVETYLEEDLPDDLKKKNAIKQFWAVLGKTIKLTFLDKDDVSDFEILYDQARINFIMAKPAYEFTFEDAEMLDQMRIYFLSAIKRSVGTTTHRFNERIILGGQINQVIRSNSESIGSTDKGGGILGKLKSIF